MKILLIEDEADLRKGVEKSLRERGYAVDGAADGEEGVYLATNGNYDAILLDVMLPKLDGWAVLEKIRAVSKTPVMMITSKGTLDDRVKGLDLGADDYLPKPFDLIELHARLRALIRRSRNVAEVVFRAGNVTLDCAKRIVTVDGVVANLTLREYALIEYLFFHRGKVVTRSELYEHLFAEEDESFSNLLDVHVCNVRKKLGKEIIATRRGHGYSLTDNE